METKKFRKIYWVTEQLDEKGFSEVTGVYTSIPDLVGKGLDHLPGIPFQAGFRITLVTLDRPGFLGRWTSPNFQSLESDLKPFVESGEVLIHHAEQLVETLKALPAVS
ncbi:MAG: hypothetical protein MH204_10905 [Fimbriimonadaceae bacterium]|nr:hypothetical protein [Fimbriimonadaceae bacterium]